jgi:hypothetical protein
MMDKDRQRQRATPAPHGHVPNWLLIAVAGAVTAAALLFRALG